MDEIEEERCRRGEEGGVEQALSSLEATSSRARW